MPNYFVGSYSFVHNQCLALEKEKEDTLIKKYPLLIIRCRNGSSVLILRNDRHYGRLLIQPH